MMDQAKQTFRLYLQEKGFRKTPERFAIFDEIYASNQHFDVELLYLKMKEKKYRVSRATIYNTMELLLNCNLIRKHQFSRNVTQYEKSFGTSQHDHVVVADSNEVIEFCDPRIESIKKTLEDKHKIKISHHTLYFYAEKSSPTSNT